MRNKCQFQPMLAHVRLNYGHAQAMAMRWHPDRPHNRDRGVEATANFRAVKAAYDPCTEKKYIEI